MAPLNTKPILLVLAAGIGSRYGGLKQIDPIGPQGETLLDYSIYDARRAGFGGVVFVIRKEIESDFRAVFGRIEREIPVAYAYQQSTDLPSGCSPPPSREKPWGTGHAVLAAAQLLNQPFGVINADDFYGRGAYVALLNHLAAATHDYAMVGYPLRNTLSPHSSVSRGVCRIAAHGYLESVDEIIGIEPNGAGAIFRGPSGQNQTLSGEEIVSMNMWGFTPQVFSGLEALWLTFLRDRGREPNAEFFLPNAICRMVQSNQARVKVLRASDSWFGVTSRLDRPTVTEALRSLIARGDYPEKLWS